MTQCSPIRTDTQRPAIPPSEQGYVLLFAIFLMALLALSLAVAVPQIAKSIQRDRDLETFHRGMQYRRAIQLYYRKFHVYPPNVDALNGTDDIRFLRKKYTDPITGKNDWTPILYGQNKTPTAMGFFGEPFGGSNITTLAGIGPGGSGLDSSSNTVFGSSAQGDNSITGSSGSGSGGTNSNGATGSTTGSGSATDSGSDSGPSGQTFGGAGIIGLSPGSPKQSILIYKTKNHYNEWEFTYDPLSDMPVVPGNAGPIGQQAGGTSGTTNTPGSGSGSGSGSGQGSPTGGNPLQCQPNGFSPNGNLCLPQ